MAASDVKAQKQEQAEEVEEGRLRYGSIAGWHRSGQAGLKFGTFFSAAGGGCHLTCSGGERSSTYRVLFFAAAEHPVRAGCPKAAKLAPTIHNFRRSRTASYGT